MNSDYLAGHLKWGSVSFDSFLFFFRREGKQGEDSRPVVYRVLKSFCIIKSLKKNQKRVMEIAVYQRGPNKTGDSQPTPPPNSSDIL